MKKKLLLITSRFPYPPIGGDRLKNYNLIKILSKNFDVTLIVINLETIRYSDINAIKKYVKNIKIFNISKIYAYINVIKNLFFSKEPLQIGYYYYSYIQEYIDKEIDKYDFVISTLIRTAKYLENTDKLKFLDIVDSIGLNYTKSQENVKSFFWKFIYKIEANRLLKYEKKYIKMFDNTFFVNRDESEYYKKYGNTLWLPNGVNEKLFTYDKYDKKYNSYIAFLGNMSYQPNVDAVLWFVNNVFPLLDKNIKFIIIGKNPKRKIKNLEKKFKNIEVTGFLEDPYKILNSVFATVAPMQTGGGIQNKILEAMALGQICITSSLAGKSIYGAIDKRDFIIEDEPNDYANIINDIFRNRNKYKYLKINAKNFIIKNYTWKNYEKKLFKSLWLTYNTKNYLSSLVKTPQLKFMEKYSV